MKILIAAVLSLSLASAGYTQEPVVQTIPITLQLKIEPAASSPQPPVIPALAAPVTPPPDYTALLQSILASTQLLVTVQAKQLAIEQDTNSQLTTINKTWVQTLGDFGKWAAAYIAPSVISILATLKATGKL